MRDLFMGKDIELIHLVNRGDNVNMDLKIGKVLKRLLREQGLTTKELARRTGTPYATLNEWKNDRSPKNIRQVKKVAEELNVTLHYLLFGENDDQEPIQKILKEDLFSGVFEISIKRIKNLEE
ncbi:MAG: helix-turn-helix transcriptional regulator [Flavobacteriaceae bacterium]|nr:helix-turn-helix transcriptional regulator [Flavobacteriaceae bacterium]